MKSVLIGTAIFALSFSLGLFTKMNGDFRKDPWAVKWDDTVGSVVEDLSYGDQPAQKFDLYVPAGPSEKNTVWLRICMPADLLPAINRMTERFSNGSVRKAIPQPASTIRSELTATRMRVWRRRPRKLKRASRR